MPIISYLKRNCMKIIMFLNKECQPIFGLCVCGVLKYCLYNFLKRPSVLEHESSARAVGTDRDVGTKLGY